MKTSVAGPEIAYDVAGGNDAPPLILVHGSWVDRHQWNAVVPLFAPSFRVVTYDRRGHGESERPAGQGSIEEDVSDLAAMIEHIAGAPAHVAANSYGAIVALRLAARSPNLIRTLSAHEPPAIGIIAADPDSQAFLPEMQRRFGAVIDILERGEYAAGAQMFVESIALGPGSWQMLPPEARDTFIFNAPTWLDEARDPEALNMDLNALRAFGRPVLLTAGGQSPAFYAAVLDKIAAALPHVARHTFAEAGHLPHVTCPEAYAQTISAFALATSARR